MNNWQWLCLIISANILAIGALALPILLVNLYTPPQVRGFDPDDATISLSFKPDTFSPEAAVLGAIAILVVVVVPTEYYVAYRSLRHTDLNVSTNFARLTRCAGRTLLPIFGVFGACLALTGLTTDIIKYMVARPRPCFLHMCKPNYTLLEYEACRSCGSAAHPGPFWPLCPGCPYLDATQSSVVCNDGNWWSSRDMWLSFPSGHSSYAFFIMTYLAMYVHRRFGGFRFVYHFLVALRPLLIFLSLVFALIVALSRISDHRHRVTDVLGGSILGAAIAIWSFLCITVKAVYPLIDGGKPAVLSAKPRNSHEAAIVTDDTLVENGNIESVGRYNVQQAAAQARAANGSMNTFTVVATPSAHF